MRAFKTETTHSAHIVDSLLSHRPGGGADPYVNGNLGAVVRRFAAMECARVFLAVGKAVVEDDSRVGRGRDGYVQVGKGRGPLVLLGQRGQVDEHLPRGWGFITQTLGG